MEISGVMLGDTNIKKNIKKMLKITMVTGLIMVKKNT
jgi:hypothetical protein